MTTVVLVINGRIISVRRLRSTRVETILLLVVGPPVLDCPLLMSTPSLITTTT